jgi:hypothetical protein
MQFLFIGGHHNCPLCPRRTTHLLSRITRRFGPPTAVALEWDQRFSSHLAASRPQLAHDLAIAWAPQQPVPGLLLDLAAALAWEPSAAAAAVPHPHRRLWLESGKVGNIAHSVQYWRNRMIAYLPNLALLAQPQAALKVMAESAHHEGNAAFRTWPHEYERDHRWFAKIKKRLTVGDPGWTAVLVGYLHCTEKDDHTLWHLMRESGRDCRRVFPCMTPPADWG